VLVVPIQKDVIETTDGNTYRVIEYTNYKEGGPAVYARSKSSKELVLVYFFDITSINRTKVEYQRGSKVFQAFGKIDRLQHLPQPDDKITVLTDTVDAEQDGSEKVDVESLKLKSKSLGVNKGLFVKDTDGNAYRLKQILDIQRSLGGNKFDRDSFLSYYKDYTGV
jgi:hypothetical protein